VRITSEGLTTFENLKNVYNGNISPYHQGIFWNYWTMCCNPQTPSLVPAMHTKLTAKDYVAKYVDPLGRHRGIYERYMQHMSGSSVNDSSDSGDISFLRDSGIQWALLACALCVYMYIVYIVHRFSVTGRCVVRLFVCLRFFYGLSCDLLEQYNKSESVWERDYTIFIVVYTMLPLVLGVLYIFCRWKSRSVRCCCKFWLFQSRFVPEAGRPGALSCACFPASKINLN
jgi:hypothetical protein